MTFDDLLARFAVRWARKGRAVTPAVKAALELDWFTGRVRPRFLGWVFAALALACGSVDNGDLFEPYEESDAGSELGTAEQGLSSRFSPTYTYGWEVAGFAQARLTPGPNPAILPGTTTIKFKIDAATEYPACNNALDRSWVYQVRRAMGDVEWHTKAQGYTWPFIVTETTGSDATVIFKAGACPGADTSNNMGAFICPAMAPGAVTVTESQFGTYKRYDGVLTVFIDQDDIWRRSRPGVFPLGVNCTAGNEAHHELTEHAAHLAALYPFGSGMYPVATPYDNGYPSWSTPVVEPYTSSGSSPFSAGGYPDGQLCRIGSWLGAINTNFIPRSGACND